MATLTLETSTTGSEKAAGELAATYWQIGLKAHQSEPDQPTTAMKSIWAAMFPADLTQVAKIVGALYGDHYFEDNQMSVTKLANELSAALGKNPADCLNAATIAFRQWYGLSVRANFQDGAVIPRQGNALSSPDVVINGTVATTPKRLIEMWNQMVWGPVSGGKNLLYGRAASVNLPVPITQPVMKMFVVEAAINPPNPQSWQQVYTQKDSARTAALENIQGVKTLQPGDRAANADGFMWDVPGAGHYCVISVAGSEFFSNDPSHMPPDNWNSGMWITNNGAAGWHNLGAPLGNSIRLKVHNLDATTERFAIEAHCSELPEGTTVSLETADEGLATPLRSGAVRISAKDQVVGGDTELPGHYTGDVIVRFETPDGAPLPPRAVIDVRGYWHVAPGHTYYEDAVNRVGDTHAIALSRPVRLYAGSFTLVGKL
jgi:hypothetical protein